MKNNEKTVFTRLSEINVNDKTEKKGNLTYLSWAWAWAEVKKLYPSVKRTVYETPQGLNYFNDHATAWVKVGVTIEDVEHIDYLPIMDYKNKSIKVDNITSFDVNKAIQRSTTKALALHGLGLYIYAGEDLPENSKQEQKPKSNKDSIDDKRLEKALESVKNGNYTLDKLNAAFELTDLQRKKVSDFTDLLNNNYAELEKQNKILSNQNPNNNV